MTQRHPSFNTIVSGLTTFPSIYLYKQLISALCFSSSSIIRTEALRSLIRIKILSNKKKDRPYLLISVCKGTSPCLLRFLGSAPFFSKFSTIAIAPVEVQICIALCNTVFPAASVRLISVPS